MVIVTTWTQNNLKKVAKTIGGVLLLDGIEKKANKKGLCLHYL